MSKIYRLFVIFLILCLQIFASEHDYVYYVVNPSVQRCQKIATTLSRRILQASNVHFCTLDDAKFRKKVLIKRVLLVPVKHSQNSKKLVAMTFLQYIGKTCGFLGYALQYACVTHCTFEYIGDFVMCSGPSMEPTLETNNILLTEHITPRLQRLQRGDIVIAKSPTNPKQNICKRITALPGDRVRGHFFRRSEIVPRGHVWLEGDNSSNSSDSRVYGPVPQGLIRSRVVCRVWPLDKIRTLTET